MIKPCPFCGGKAELDNFGFGEYSEVDCKNTCVNSHCGASGPCKSSDEEAIAAWNAATVGKYAEGYIAGVNAVIWEVSTMLDALHDVKRRLESLKAGIAQNPEQLYKSEAQQEKQP